MTEQQERKNKRTAAATAIGFHTLLLVLMFVITAWTPPDPPLGSGGGMEVHLGFDNEGDGDVLPKEPAGSTSKQNDDAPKQEEAQQQTTPPTETKQQAVVEEKTAPAKEADEHSESQLESPVTVPPKKKDEEEKKTVEPIKKVEPTKKEEPVKTVDKQAVFNPTGKTTSSTDKTGQGKEGQPANFGDDKGKTGNKGNPNGTPDSKALYGNPGSGGSGPGGAKGAGLQMAGWDWDQQPKAPELDENESGRVVFKVTIDDQGEIVSIEVEENRGMSPESVRRLTQKIRERSFTRSAAGDAPLRTTGKVIWDLTVK